jgi:hypothetical protein
MATKVKIELIYAALQDVAAREIEGELIIVPLVAGIGDMEDDLFTLNQTEIAIWDPLDSKKKLKDVVRELSPEFDALAGEIDREVIGLVDELLKRRMLIEVSKG